LTEIVVSLGAAGRGSALPDPTGAWAGKRGRAELRCGGIPVGDVKLVAGEYVGAGSLGIALTSSGGNFVGISLGPWRFADGDCLLR